MKPLMTAIATLALCLAGAARSGTAQPPATTRQMVLDRTEAGRYAWKLVRVAVPAIGDHEVLVHMRAVSLQHGDIEIVDALSAASATGRDHTGQIVCSDGAGDVVAIGKLVRGVRVGSRVTSLYFSDYLDEPLSAEKQAKGHGYTANGVLGDYVVLEVAYGGTISLVGGLSGYGADLAADDLIHKAARAQGIYAGSRADYLRMSEFIKKHRIHPAIERTYTLDQYEEALKDLAAGNFVGKLVIRL